MASRPLPTKTPSTASRATRRAPAAPADVVSASGAGAGRVVGRDRQAVETSTDPALSSPKRLTPRGAAHNSTVLFRALLLVAAAAALAFTVAALISPPSGSAGPDATSPDAPPPAVFVQPDR